MNKVQANQIGGCKGFDMGANDINMQVSSESSSYGVLGKIRTFVTTVSSSSRAVVLFSLVLLLGALFSLGWINNSFFTSTTIPLPFTCPTGNNSAIPAACPSAATTTTTSSSSSSSSNYNKTITPALPRNQSPLPFTCPTGNNSAIPAACPSAATATTTTTSSNYNKTITPALPLKQSLLPSPTCPAYFRWIHEDLRPWNTTGITQEMLDRASKHANFRLLVVDGRAYLDRNRGAFQTRDVFTLWGVLQLLRRYPGRVPDLDLMFNCEDMPVVRSADYHKPNSPAPPPLFRYCKDETTVDIVFPDWSFWGWPEINIKPWEVLMAEMRKGNKRMKWVDREPHAYWKGNPWVSKTRQELLTCNVSKGREWNARVYVQNWDSEIKQGFKGSDLANQCHYRYKIYIDGRAWSVSEKYILACDSPVLMVRTRFQDFFSRGLMPMKHYWPVREDDKCRSIKFAVEWGNSHQQEAQAMGKAGSGFTQEQLKMDYVYDYMLHLLSEYSKLLKFKPSVPETAVELCLESMACHVKGRQKAFMIESMVRSPHGSAPCTLPPPFSPSELKELLATKAKSTNRVKMWEQKGWQEKKV